jgi:hypothetical protein
MDQQVELTPRSQEPSARGQGKVQQHPYVQARDRQDVGGACVPESLDQFRRHVATTSQQKGLGQGVLGLSDSLRQAGGQAVSQRVYPLQHPVSVSLAHQFHTGVDHGGEYALPCELLPVVEVLKHWRLRGPADYYQPVSIAKVRLMPG